MKKRKLCSYSGPEPTVEEIEGEFWRIVESPDEVRCPMKPSWTKCDSLDSAQ